MIMIMIMIKKAKQSKAEERELTICSLAVLPSSSTVLIFCHPSK
jgi:hypothetical protein